MLRLRRVRRVRTDEEAGICCARSTCEFAGSAIQCIEQNQAAHARSDAATFEDREGRCKAAAVGDDHDRHPGECGRSALIAVHSGKLDGSFIKELPEPVRLPELAGAGIRGIDGKLRRHQHGVHA